MGLFTSSAGIFKLKVLFCDSRLEVDALVKAQRATLEVLVVWIWNNAMVQLVPYMQQTPDSTNSDRTHQQQHQHPLLIVVGLTPSDGSPSQREDTMLVFPQYLRSPARTVEQTLEILKATFAKDGRRLRVRRIASFDFTALHHIHPSITLLHLTNAKRQP